MAGAAKACLAVLVLALCVVGAQAEETSVSGTVTVVEENNEVKSITVTDEAGKAFSIVLDAKGKKLAAHKEKKVTVVGTAEEKEGVTWITVKTARPAQAAGEGKKTGGEGKKTGKKTKKTEGEAGGGGGDEGM